MAKQNQNTELFVNPFEAGVTYPVFLEAKGKQTVKEYCEGKLTAEQIEWLENDLTHYKQK
jgi:hypothetical protein